MMETLSFERMIALEPTPPDPHIPPALLVLLVSLRWSATIRDPSGTPLGGFVQGADVCPLLVVRSGSGGVSWALASSATPPPGFAPVLTSEATAAVLQGGSLNQHGELECQGHAYRVEAWYDGAEQVARAVEA